jgi:hypothetical protein
VPQQTQFSDLIVLVPKTREKTMSYSMTIGFNMIPGLDPAYNHRGDFTNVFSELPDNPMVIAYALAPCDETRKGNETGIEKSTIRRALMTRELSISLKGYRHPIQFRKISKCEIEMSSNDAANASFRLDPDKQCNGIPTSVTFQRVTL